jgi:hypothetical protein
VPNTLKTRSELQEERAKEPYGAENKEHGQKRVRERVRKAVKIDEALRRKCALIRKRER